MLLQALCFLTTGVFQINEDSNNTVIYTSLDAAQELLGYVPSQISSLNFYLHNPANEAQAIAEIKEVLGDSFLIKTRLAQNDTLYKMLNTEQAAVYLIFTLIVIIALFNVVGALIMMILEKRKDLRVLLSLGLVKKEVGQVFFFQGVLISIVGSFFGVFVGFCLVLLQKKLFFIYDNSLTCLSGFCFCNDFCCCPSYSYHFGRFGFKNCFFSGT